MITVYFVMFARQETAMKTKSRKKPGKKNLLVPTKSFVPPAALAAQIKEQLGLACKALRNSLNHARKAGQLLRQAKAQCDHGQWIPWLEKHFRISARTAQQYMQIDEGWTAIKAKAKRVSHLGVRDALKLLAKPKTESPTPKAEPKKPKAKLHPIEQKLRAAEQSATEMRSTLQEVLDDDDWPTDSSFRADVGKRAKELADKCKAIVKAITAISKRSKQKPSRDDLPDVIPDE
jgi:hypothetical protein